jgi:BlaI family transcriptional regulator, penicillinase repressor
MARSGTGRPTDQELEILKVLWDRGPSSVREVWEVLSASRDVGTTTVLKLMQIMRDKGLLICDVNQRPQVFKPKQSQQSMLKQLAGDLVTRVFGGSTKSLLLHALSSQRCSPAELAEIRQMLDDLQDTPAKE